MQTCELLVLPSLLGVGEQGFKVTISDNGEVYAMRYNQEQVGNQYSTEKVIVKVVKGEDRINLNAIIDTAAEGTYVGGLQTNTKFEGENSKYKCKFRFKNKEVEYLHNDPNRMDAEIVSIFKNLDDLLHFNKLLGLE